MSERARHLGRNLVIGSGALFDLLLPAAAHGQGIVPIPGCVDPGNLPKNLNGCYCFWDGTSSQTSSHWRVVISGVMQANNVCTPSVYQPQIEVCESGSRGGQNGECQCLVTPSQPAGGVLPTEWLYKGNLNGHTVYASCEPDPRYPVDTGILRFTDEQMSAAASARLSEMSGSVKSMPPSSEVPPVSKNTKSREGKPQPTATSPVVTAEEVQKYEKYKKQQKNSQASRSNTSNAGQASGNESDGSLPVIGIGAVGLAITGFYLWATAPGQDKYGGKMSDGYSISLKKSMPRWRSWFGGHDWKPDGLALNNWGIPETVPGHDVEAARKSNLGGCMSLVWIGIGLAAAGGIIHLLTR